LTHDPQQPLLHLVLHEPEIPNNTGTIGRTCVSLGCRLHLIRPLGFSLSEKALRRAGLDYWPRLLLSMHDDWASYQAATPGARRWLFTTKTEQSVEQARFEIGDHLVFGKESAGLPGWLTEAHPAACLRLPMRQTERSLNVACAATAAAYAAVLAIRASGDGLGLYPTAARRL
jgi:tRNA (cytidine/uridine-2'-O-)-methyltransferase